MRKRDYELLIYEVDADEKICTVTFNRPEVLNAINDQLLAEYECAMEQADLDDDVNVIIIRGAGRAFCAGDDLAQEAVEPRSDPYSYRKLLIRERERFHKIWRISKPVVVSAHKYAIGKGFGLVEMSDVAIVTEDTKFGFSEIRAGIGVLGAHLPWETHMKIAKWMLLAGGELTAHEALKAGLVTKVVKPDQLKEETLKAAKILARVPREMQVMHKHWLNRTYEMTGMETAMHLYMEMSTEQGLVPNPRYQRFLDTTLEKSVADAVREAREPFEGLD